MDQSDYTGSCLIPGIIYKTPIRIEDGRLAIIGTMADGPHDQHVMTWARSGSSMHCALNPMQTGCVDRLIRVAVNGCIVECSEITEFLAPDGTYIQAWALQAGDVLRSFPHGVVKLATTPEVFIPAKATSVFDLSVAGAGNFAVSAGVFIRAQQQNWT